MASQKDTLMLVIRVLIGVLIKNIKHFISSFILLLHFIVLLPFYHGILSLFIRIFLIVLARQQFLQLSLRIRSIFRFLNPIDPKPQFLQLEFTNALVISDQGRNYGVVNYQHEDHVIDCWRVSIQL